MALMMTITDISMTCTAGTSSEEKGNVTDDTGEITREYIRLKSIFDSIPEARVRRKQKADYERYQRIRKNIRKDPR